MVLNGLGRFFVEMLRVNPRVLVGLTEPQIVGTACCHRRRKRVLAYFRTRCAPLGA